MIIKRTNSMGLQYNLESLSDNLTAIYHAGKSMILEVSLDEINQAWYNWQMKGFMIQEAFPRLTPEEREFLLTGITPDEWKKIFSGEENTE